MMHKHLYRLSAILLLVVAGLSTNAQNTNSAMPDAKMSANHPTGTHNLGSLFTPNLYNGNLNINVPIYSYAADDQNFGVSLTYNTMGVRVDEYSSEIGTHWNVQAGPSLVRIVRDLPDECYYVTDSLLKANDPVIVNQEMYLKGKLLTYTETPAEQAAPNVYRDSECDEFIFSSSRGKVSFYIGNDFKVFTHPKRDIQVEVFEDTALSSGNRPIRIIIKDEHGDRYEFRTGNLSYFPISGFSDWQSVEWLYRGMYAPTQWVPEKIILANGQEITYSYSDLNAFQHDFKLSRGFMVREHWGNPPVLKFYLGVNEPRYGYFSQLTGISYPNDTEVSFVFDDTKESENGTMMVKEIQITAGDRCMSYNFFQHTVNGRWFLDKITQSDCEKSLEELLYSFGYNPTLLPGRLNAARDFFGYYNGDSTSTPMGASGDSITIPKHGTGYGNDRFYQPALAAAGLLTTITNAFEGEINFFYGPHIGTGQLSNVPTDANFVGKGAVSGVRIDSIVETDPYYPDSRKTTQFTYSGGQLFLTGGYFHFPSIIDSMSGAWSQVIFQDKFLTSHHLVNGANNGYSNVSVRHYVNGLMSSRKDFTFTNFKDATSNNQPRYYKVPGSKHFYDYPYTDKQYIKDWEMGLPLTISEYDRNNRILLKTINEYDFSTIDLSAASYIENTKVAKVNSGESLEVETGNGFGSYFPYKVTYTDPYYPYTGTANLVKSITLKYISDSQYVSDTARYVYDNRNNLSRITTTNSKGERFRTSLVYNYAVDGPNMPPYFTEHPGTTLYRMTADGLEKLVSTERWKLSGSGATAPTLIEASITGYQYENGKIWPKTLWKTAIGAPVSHLQYTGFMMPELFSNMYSKVLAAYNSTGGLLEFNKLSEVTLFDDKGQPLETQLQDEDLYEARIWNKQTGQVLAEAYNCRYTDIAYCSFENGFAGSNFSVSSTLYRALSGDGVTGEHALSLWELGIPTGSPIAIQTMQNLKVGKEYLLSFWSKGSDPLVFIGSVSLALGTPVYSKGSWKNYNIRFTPSVASKIAIAGTAATSLIDEVRLHPVDAQMNSQTYESLKGISSKTDASGRITYYEYDALGRLIVTRNQEDQVLSKTEYHLAQ